MTEQTSWNKKTCSQRHWQAHVKALKQSGLSRAEYCMLYRSRENEDCQFITKSPKEVIRKILEHLGIWEEKIWPPPIRPPPGKVITYESFDDGWPGYDEPFCLIN